ncbi:hypothetical protein F4820DRAFT_258733 [Hypoxylon rubiginosum]|uniref:Uncharacterized protein n=1 Tax=Hypoxylon rubiginosum TaxID=110542 RepID=A0ACB9ZG63_9PEZI|nr:hypothetical protein F4820DRAFT_258733 [Hypoxylon rubiginosum]
MLYVRLSRLEWGNTISNFLLLSSYTIASSQAVVSADDRWSFRVLASYVAQHMGYLWVSRQPNCNLVLSSRGINAYLGTLPNFYSPFTCF